MCKATGIDVLISKEDDDFGTRVVHLGDCFLWGSTFREVVEKCSPREAVTVLEHRELIRSALSSVFHHKS